MNEANQHIDDARQYLFGGRAFYEVSGRRIDPERELTIEKLRRELDKAIEVEDYERAAVLRDRLKKMTHDEPD